MKPPVALPPLREVIKRHGLTANKALGQNFLFDMQLLERIAAVPGDLEGQAVFEVGPGPGGLTRALLQAGARVTAVERDRRCLPALEELEEHFPGQLTVIDDDALKIDLADLFDEPFHILSNLPYNVGSALLVKWLSEPQWPPQWQSLTLMFHREVAVHRSAFTPPPKVMSAIVHLVPKAQPEGIDPKVLADLTQAAFGQRRKMLRQSLKGLAGALEALEALCIDSARRPETVSVDEFVAIARLLTPAP